MEQASDVTPTEGAQVIISAALTYVLGVKRLRAVFHIRKARKRGRKNLGSTTRRLRGEKPWAGGHCRFQELRAL